MRSLVPKLLTAAIVLAAALVWVPAAGAVPTVSGRFELGTEINGNNKIVAGPDGNMWFTLPGKKVGKISPAGLIQEFELAGIENTNGIAVGPEGRIWVVAIGKAASFLPSDPKGTEQDFESALINAEANIALGPEGMFWVASNAAVAKFSPANFKGTIVEVPHTGEIKPKDIDVAGSLIVISDAETIGVLETSRVVTFTSAGVQKDFAIPGPSQGLAGAATGQLAYSAPGAKPEQSGLITPPAPASAFELLGDPFGVALGADQAFWIVQFAAGGLTRLTSTGQTSFLGGLPVETARQIAAGPGNTLWVTLTHKEKVVEVSEIARITGLEPPVSTPPTGGGSGGGPITVTQKPVPDTTFGKGPKKVVKTTGAKATVKFTFSASVAGSTFQCRLTKVTPGKKAKASKAAFAGCRSPKVLRLAPGKYRFAVRAVAAGAIDGSPAEKAFRVVRAPRHR
jgi:sugar lactone lactonase YvrE